MYITARGQLEIFVAYIWLSFNLAFYTMNYPLINITNIIHKKYSELLVNYGIFRL